MIMRRAQAVIAVTLLASIGSPLVVAAETLAEIKRRNYLEVCAHPDALPYSSQNSNPPGFQLDLGRMIAEDLGVGFRVDWIVYTKHSRVMNCDALMGVILKEDGAKLKGVKPSIPYAGSGWVLVLPKNTPTVMRFEDVPGDKGIGVQYSSWVHYSLDTRKVKTRQFLNDLEILDALSRGEVAAGAVVNTYAGWYVHLQPGGGVRLVEDYTPEPDLRWNVALGLKNVDQPLVDAVNAILTRRMADGSVKSIFAKYGVTYYPPFDLSEQPKQAAAKTE